MKIEKATIVGLSLGGVLTADFALEHWEMVESLVFIGAGLGGYEGNRTKRRLKTNPNNAVVCWK